MNKPNPYDKYLLSTWRKSRKTRTPNNTPNFNRRMIAATLDSIVLMLLTPVFDWLSPLNRSTLGDVTPPDNISTPISYMVVRIFGNKEFMASWVDNFLLQMAAYMIYSAFFWHFFSATPGKMIMKMKLVQTGTTKPITPLQILLRLCGYVMSGTCLMLGFLWIGVNKRHRAWHDYLADTEVIDTPWNLTFWKKPAAPPPPPAPQDTETP